GLSAGLLLAARLHGDDEWEQAAVDIGCDAISRPPVRTGIVELSLCHGSSGFAHLCNRMYPATRIEAFADAARQWYRWPLEYMHEHQTVASVFGARMPGSERLKGFLEGA